MSYAKQNFKPGDVLLASQLNAMDDQIALNEAASKDFITSAGEYAAAAAASATAAETSAEAAEAAAGAASDSADAASDSEVAANNSATAAALSAQGAYASAAAADASETAAATSAQNAADSATAAETSAQNAAASQEAAAASASAANGYKTQAEGSSNNASRYAQQAEEAKTNANTYKKAAQSARDAAVTARDAAVTAQGISETARDEAFASQRNASVYATTAGTHRTAAETAANNASAYADAASNSATAASGSATAASGSASAAAQSAQTAQDVAESIPEDYSQLSDDVSGLKSALNTSAVMRRAPSLTSSDDVNTITTPGVYLAVSAQNLPETGTFVLMHFRTTQTLYGTSHWDAQIAIKETDTSKMWKRFGYNGTWKNWNLVPSSITDLGTAIVTRTYLANNFAGNTNIQTSGDCNDALNDGLYWVSNGAAHTPTAEYYYLFVSGCKFGSTQCYFQIAFASDTTKVYYRSKFGTYDFTAWKNMLFDTYSVINAFNRTQIAASGDCNNAVDAGYYLVNPGAAHTPIENATFLLCVDKYYMTVNPTSSSTYWLTQIATTADNAARTYVRKMYASSGVTGAFSDWVELTNDVIGEFIGKKIACFGDSITENGDYPSRFADKTGATVYKCGFGGCRMSTYGNNTYSTMCMSYLSDYIASGDFTDLIAGAQDVYERTGDDNRTQAALVSTIDYSSLDYMILFWGTNDYGGNIPIGNDTDEGHDTFKGAINLVVKNLLTAYPNIHLIFITPFWRATYTGVSGFCDSDTYTNPLGFKLPDYVDALVSRANALHVPVLNLYDSMCLGKYNYEEWLVDGLHPKSGKGYEYVAQKITAGFRSFYSA